MAAAAGSRNHVSTNLAEFDCPDGKTAVAAVRALDGQPILFSRDTDGFRAIGVKSPDDHVFDCYDLGTDADVAGAQNRARAAIGLLSSTGELFEADEFKLLDKPSGSAPARR